MSTRLEAPAKEPSSCEETALGGSALERRFGATVALSGLELNVASGEIVAIVGPSGCGKSTLLELFAGLQEPDAGTIEGGGLEQCAFMPQRDLLLPWRDGLGNAALALECKKIPRREARRQAAP